MKILVLKYLCELFYLIASKAKIKIELNEIELSVFEVRHFKLENAIASYDTSNKTGLHPS